jgi:hypothetical protein
MTYSWAVVATYCDPSVLTGGVVDLEKLQPILFAMNDRSYWGIGKKLAKVWSVGKDSKSSFFVLRHIFP